MFELAEVTFDTVMFVVPTHAVAGTVMAPGLLVEGVITTNPFCPFCCLSPPLP